MGWPPVSGTPPVTGWPPVSGTPPVTGWPPVLLGPGPVVLAGLGEPPVFAGLLLPVI
jgi:hypothetical protein